MRYAINPELDAQLKEEWNRIGLSKETRRIARCLIDENLSPEKIKRILAVP